MKKIFFLLIPFWLNAQIGIGTAKPLADLHVAGTNATVRIQTLNAVNSPTYNDGLKPAKTYVNGMGDITLNPSANNGSGPGGTIAPLNFLLTQDNFIPDGVSSKGTIINNNTTTNNVRGFLTKVNFSAANTALIEVKYSVSVLLSSTDLNSGLTSFNDMSVRVFKIYFCIDVNDDGLDAVELSKKYGLNAQCYSSETQGILGYSYTNGHGYTTIPAGNHSLHFFAEVIDGSGKYTSVGFGGKQDSLRIRIYN